MKATKSVEQPEAQLIQIVMGAYASPIIAESSRLGVPDVLKKHGPLTASEIVTRGGVDAVPDALERMLRAAASVGVYTEDEAGRFGLTEMSETLTSDSANSIKKFIEGVGGPWLKMMTELFDSVRTGRSQCHKIFGMGWWDYLNANPRELEDFGEAMKANSLNSLKGVLEHCDFSGVRSVADVGGGFGHLAVALLEKYPDLKATVVDLPDLIPVAKTSFPIEDPSVSSRLGYVGGDMFESVPPAEVYIMKHIIHDWTDEKCAQLLKNCHTSMQGDGRVIAVDSVLPPLGETGGTSAKLIDMLMLAGIDGKERTEAQWSELFDSAGLEISSVTPLNDNIGTSIVEGVKRA